MRGGVQLSSAARSAIALCWLAATGCATVTPAPPEEPVVTAVAPVEPITLNTAPVVPVPTPSAPAPAAAVQAPLPADTADTAAPVTPATTVTLATSAAPAAPLGEPSSAAVPVVTPLPAVAPPLDFTSLATRLRQAKTIGVLTKLAVKNQADTLLDQLRAYHRRQGTATLTELRTSYDMLLLKVLSLLQDNDPPLAHDIVQSRTAIWDILADPRKFIASNLMAGVSNE